MKNTKTKIKRFVGASNRMLVQKNQYNVLEFMQMNRLTTPNHIKGIKESIVRHGCHRLVIVVKNELTGGYMIVDGQNMVRALMCLNRAIECTIVECESNEHLIQLMIDLNTTSRSWKLPDYVHTWAESGKVAYKILKAEQEKSEIQISVVAMAYSQKRRGIVTNDIHNGSFTITDKKRGDELIGFLKDCHNFMSNNRINNEALIQLMVSVGNYNHKKMMKNFASANFVAWSQSEGKLYNQLLEIYSRR